MPQQKQRIMTIDAKELFLHCTKKLDEQVKPFLFNTTKRTLYTQVVSRENMMEDCPLFYQFIEVIKEIDNIEEDDIYDNILYDKLLVVDFDDIFMPIDEDKTSEKAKIRKERFLKNAKDIITNGFYLRFKGEIDGEYNDILMRPFDKSGNMSRKGRITFVAEKYVDDLNRRLNLDIDFSKVPVLLSKYYAYRGLYLSTSQRVEIPDFEITPETLVIIKDQRLKSHPNTRGARKGEYGEVDGPSYEKNVLISTAEGGEFSGEWEFAVPKKTDVEYNDIPYDGQGLVVPDFADSVNKALEIEGANSFQIRLPFAKGMVHKVDVEEFLKEFTKTYPKEYWYEDAFGHKRDLRKAKILITESMFKCKGWLVEYCNRKKQNGPENKIYQDPMKYYCEMLKQYKHALYVSGTDLPYGHTQYTHLSYQAINTLAFSDEQFEKVIGKHSRFIDEPLEFLSGYQEISKGTEDSVQKLTNLTPNWKKAARKNAIWKQDVYVKEQLNNIQKGLISKIATGKILVEGQTRYLCRDLLPVLACLLSEENEIREFYKRYLFNRFYMPSESKNLKYSEYYAFFRNPHLSRNEQCIMRPFVSISQENYVSEGKTYEKYKKYIGYYKKYFGHLTGVVMFPRGSIAPLCLGGADFDGDLVSVIFSKEVVDAVKVGAYEQISENCWLRNIPTVKIPSVEGEKVTVPKYVPYEHIHNTFSNRIGEISNAAISIAQKEYTTPVKKKAELLATEPTCDKCTLLTGLEIDAAKNGIHPNLDIVLNSRITTCEYLRFLLKYKKLKSQKYFRWENLKIKKEKSVKGEVISVSASGCKTVAKFWIPGRGTYVNKLPVLFYEHCEKYRKINFEKTVIDVSSFFKNLSKEQKETIKEFQNECKAVLNLYFFYKKIFFENLKKEKNKGFYAEENLELLIDKMYDRDRADEIQYFLIPELKKKMSDIIGENSSIQKIQERINEYQWQFQPEEKRLTVLEKIIGNGFKADMLTKEEQELLCYFNHQGYKVLWFVFDTIEGPKSATFDEMLSRVSDIRNEYISENLEKFAIELNEILRQHYDNNAEDVASTLYDRCLKEIKEIIKRYCSDKETTILVATLYDLTKSKTNSKNRKFFWDAFEWDELKEFVMKVDESYVK